MTQLTLEEVAQRLGVAYGTVKVWRHRGKLPEPDEIVGRTPVWNTETIDAMERGSNGNGTDPTT